MKTNVNILLTAAAFCLTAWSCSGEDSTPLPPAPETPEQPIDPDALCTITPGSIAIAPVDMLQTPLTRSATGEPEQKATYSENLGHNSSMEATLEAMPQGAQTRASLASNVRYRVVVYDNTGAIVKNLVYTGNNTAPDYGENFQLNAGTYRLFAYSFNTATAPALNADGRTVPVTSADDFMTYTVPNFTIGANDCLNGKTLDIKFVRQCAKLTVTIKSDGYSPGNITGAYAYLFGDVINNATWSSSNSDNSILTPPIGTDNTPTEIKQWSGSSGNSIDCGTGGRSYTCVAPFSGKTLKLRSIFTRIDGKIEQANDPISFPNLTLVKGGSYKLTITMGNYYVIDNAPAGIGYRVWAIANLQQSGSGNSASVSFCTNPWDHGSHWNWGIRDATRYGSKIYLSGGNVAWNITTAGHANQDPCRALPGGKWRLPQKSDFDKLLNDAKATSGTKVKINNVLNTLGNNGWAPNAQGTVFISFNHKVLFFPKVKIRFYDNSMGSLSYYSTSECYDFFSDTDNSKCYVLNLDATNFATYYTFRYNGTSVRCVSDL